jgi:hypothetical protein
MDGVSMIELYLANRDIRRNHPTFEELGKLNVSLFHSWAECCFHPLPASENIQEETYRG